MFSGSYLGVKLCFGATKSPLLYPRRKGEVSTTTHIFTDCKTLLFHILTTVKLRSEIISKSSLNAASYIAIKIFSLSFLCWDDW